MSDTPMKVMRWTSADVSPAPDTGGFVAYGDVLKLEANLAAMTAKRDALLKTFPHCDKHKPNGGHRAGCVICSGEKLCAALSRIDYACEVPNEMEMSGYDLHCDEDTVVANVQKLRAERDALKAMCAELAESLEFCAGTSYITDAHREATEALAKWETMKKGGV